MKDSPSTTEETDHNTQLAGLAQIFYLLGTDCLKNIDTLVEQACILLGGAYSLYNRIDEHSQAFKVQAGYNRPQDFDRQFSSKGRICREATIKGKNKAVAIEDLEKTRFFTTDPHVQKYNLKSYLGFPVKCRDRVIGSLCIVDLNSRIFTPDDIHCLQTIAAVLSREEEHLLIKNDLKRAQEPKFTASMAGSTAHDLNNILSGLVSYPELLLLQLKENSPLYEPVALMLESGINAADIVQDMLTLTRKKVTFENVINLNTTLNEYLAGAAYHHLVSKYPNIQFNIRLDPDLLNLRGSETHIKKTLTNLVIHATENTGNSGAIDIETFNAQMDSPFIGYETIPEDKYVVLRVTNSGPGVPEELLPRIFEPFFTPQKMGRKTSGLGLYVVWNSVKDHNGYIEVKSSPGKGLMFEIYFPACRKEVGGDSGSSLSPNEKKQLNL